MGIEWVSRCERCGYERDPVTWLLADNPSPGCPECGGAMRDEITLPPPEPTQRQDPGPPRCPNCRAELVVRVELPEPEGD